MNLIVPLFANINVPARDTPAKDLPVKAESSVKFVRELRAHGLAIPVQASVTYADALDAMNVSKQSEIYWAGRIALLTDPKDIPVYDEVFQRFWGRFWGTSGMMVEMEQEQLAVGYDTDEDLEDSSEESEQTEDDIPEDDPEQDEAEIIAVRYSHEEMLADKDFSQCSPEELAEMTRLFAQLRLGGAKVMSRRLRPSLHARGPLDIRQTVSRGLRTGGELLRWYHAQPRERLRRLVLLVDVSGSMASYARALLRFTHAAVAARRRVEVFAMGTRLTRLTRELATHDPDAALASAAEAVMDWSGGTRLGDALAEFNTRWGIPGMARGAVVVILSDGWDRGDPEAISEQMIRLHRAAHRLIWVNPLKATPDYAPLARGMAAALPHVDNFVSGHSFNALRELAEIICSEGELEERFESGSPKTPKAKASHERNT